MKYLVTGSEGPGFGSPDEVAEILRELVLPSFEMLQKLEGEKKILAGGMPVGERSFVFIVEAASNDEVDQLLRRIPMWGTMSWEVTPLQTFGARAATERQVLKSYS